tara:strand:+ start:138 stop:341 length:204 start_codon:yes stop_codon:yes gene_type:complete
MREDIQRESSGSRQTQSGGESAVGSGGNNSGAHIQLLSEVDKDLQILERQKFIKYGIIGVVLYMVCC